MKSYPQAAKGLYKVFLGQALSSTMAVLMAGTAMGSIAALAGLVLNLMGLYQAKADDRAYGIAFLLAASALAVNFMCNLVIEAYPFLAGIASPVRIMVMILNLATLFFVCKATAALCVKVGQEKPARFARPTLLVNVLCTAVSVVLTIILIISTMEDLIVPLSNLVIFVSLLGSLLYILFLFRAGRALDQAAVSGNGIEAEEDYGDDGYGDYEDYNDYDDYDDEEEEESDS
ncbi:MAG TPA: hypothetical protein IAC25_02200 [Candidatus Enterenecus stercoripullorum]|nr:hypothetical protein [Candidatus Enterenecus stercoripullorum]